MAKIIHIHSALNKRSDVVRTPKMLVTDHDASRHHEIQTQSTLVQPSRVLLKSLHLLAENVDRQVEEILKI